MCPHRPIRRNPPERRRRIRSADRNTRPLDAVRPRGGVRSPPHRSALEDSSATDEVPAVRRWQGRKSRPYRNLHTRGGTGHTRSALVGEPGHRAATGCAGGVNRCDRRAARTCGWCSAPGRLGPVRKNVRQETGCPGRQAVATMPGCRVRGHPACRWSSRRHAVSVEQSPAPQSESAGQSRQLIEFERADVISPMIYPPRPGWW